MRYGYETTDKAIYHLLLEKARWNRQHATDAERKLWFYLRDGQLGARFRRQHPVHGYIPDFICLSKRLIIEVDGEYHSDAEQMEEDEERTCNLESIGYVVLRFTNFEVLNQTDKVIQNIKNTMQIQSEKQSIDQNVSIKDHHEGEPPLLRRGRGRFIFSAPSGSGKSTLINWLMTEHPELNLYFSVSCTSRAPRGTEQNGVEYFFLTPEEFRQKIENDEFLEYEEVYQDRFYGTLKEQVERQIAAGQNVVFDVDVKGGCNIKKHYGDQALSIFIQPPSVEVLRQRLVNRGTDTPEAIEARVAKAAYELTFADQFDVIVVNDDLEKAKADVYRVVKEALSV